MEGEKGTPYENGFFEISVSFPSDYPFRSPSVYFVTPIYHFAVGTWRHSFFSVLYIHVISSPSFFLTFFLPNLSGQSGDMCLDILYNRWSPSCNISQVLTEITQLIHQPEVVDPAVRSFHAKIRILSTDCLSLSLFLFLSFSPSLSLSSPYSVRHLDDRGCLSYFV